MDMAAKQAETLTEVIYPTMDGYIYFIELTSGEYTREPLYIGYSFKGTGSLDPRGYPILYLGAGYTSALGKSRVFVISLIDGSILYTFGNDDYRRGHGQAHLSGRKRRVVYHYAEYGV